MAGFRELFNKFSEIKVGVIGDIMLDTYWWGKVERISPEAPVPVVSLERKEYRIGGAGNVALNLSCLLANVHILSVIGSDEEGSTLKVLLNSNNIETGFLISSDQRITTSKTRVISRNQQMMRLDAEITRGLAAVDELAFLAGVARYIQQEKPDIIIFEDYDKGVLSPDSIAQIIDLCKTAGVLTAVDPKRKNFFSYRGVDIFKPNLKEVKDGLNLLFEDFGILEMKSIHEALSKKLQHKISLITLSEKGVFYQHQDRAGIIPSHLRNIADVSGAGDTVIAVASLVYACTGDISISAEIANIAGGLVCEEVGTVAISRQRLLEECGQILAGYSAH